MDKKRVRVIANPVAGTRRDSEAVQRLAWELERRGLEVELAWTQQAGHASRLAGEADEGTRCIVACGGDGTLGEVVNGRPRVPIALLPMGNENLFARELGYRPRDVTQTAEAVAAGRTEAYDLGTAGQKRFTTMAGIGFDAMVVDLVDHARRGPINKLFYAVPILEALREYEYGALRVRFDDGHEELSGGFVFIFNVAQYGGGLPICPEAQGQDGLLDVCVFQRSGARELFRYGAGVLLGRHTRMPDFRHVRTARVHLSAEAPARYQLDGDPGGPLPATFACAPAAARFVLPERPKAR